MRKRRKHLENGKGIDVIVRRFEHELRHTKPYSVKKVRKARKKWAGGDGR